MVGDFIRGLIAELITTLIAIPLVTYIVVRFFQNFRAARIWDVQTKFGQVLNPRPFPTIVLATSGVHEGPGDYLRPMTGIGQVRALARFGKSLGGAYRNSLDETRVVFSEECHIHRDEFTNDLVLVGGPKTNKITRQLLQELRVGGVLPEDFAFETTTEIDSKGDSFTFDTLTFEGARYVPSEGEVVGVVVRCHNPLSASDRVLTIAAGLGTYGTDLAGKALVELWQLHQPAPFSPRWLKMKLGRKRKQGFTAVVSAKLSGEGISQRIGEVRLLRFIPVNWSVSASS